MRGIIGVVDEEVIAAEGDASVLDLIQEFDNSPAAFVIREAVEVDGFGEHFDLEDIIEGGSAGGSIIVHVFCHLISSISGVVNQAVGMRLPDACGSRADYRTGRASWIGLRKSWKGLGGA
jgi:hypothetical protein